ncbi:hypothetical protein CMI37_01580 [Candidatus Pacearchaeota archaeon]|nr:hypothetical protein [Candidatus Pacearchaeota archaeon]|tara:strand:- start:241 stop:657 length:417 start_codon:yes stop_codon:yes gene_type:complete
MRERAEVDCVIPINPLPCPRPRITSKGWAYYPKKYKAWKEEAETLIRETMKSFNFEEPFSGELSVVAVFVCKRPKTTKLPRPKPDIDNYLKALLDAGNGIAWKDDCIISGVGASKAWGKPGEEGCIRLLIREAYNEAG